MKQLCVFDLDGTLIDYDSFGRLVRPLVSRRPGLLVAACMRRAGLLSRAAFAERAHAALCASLRGAVEFQNIATTIACTVDAERRRLVADWRAKGAHLVLLSASPMEYVEPLAKHLGFAEGFGSHWVGSRYRHLYGDEKRHFIEERFPADKWHRTFAIADQESDNALLALFSESRRVTWP